MSEKKNIDRLFQEKFKDFEANPPEHVWENIEAELKKKKKKRVIPLWFKMGGVAAVLLIGIWLINPFGNNIDVNNNPVVNSNNTNENTNNDAGNPLNNTENSNEIATPINNGQNFGTNEAVTVGNESNSAEENGENISNSGTNQNGIITNPKSGFGNTNSNAVVHNNSANGSSNSKSTAKENVSKENDKQKQNSNEYLYNQNAVAYSSETEHNKANNIGNDSNPSSTENNNNGSIVNSGVIPNEKSAVAQTENGQDKNTNNAEQNNEQNSGNYILTDKGIKAEEVIAETVVDTTAGEEPENELEKLLQEKLNGEKEDKEKMLAEADSNKKWNIKPQIAPVFYNSLSEGSPIDSQFAGNTKDYDNNLSYGVGVDYALNDRISIRSGINTVNLSYSTRGVEFFPSMSQQTNNISGKAAARAANLVVQNQPTPVNGFSTASAQQTFKGSMLQETGYIEVPLEMSYAVLNKKFGIDVIGGFSTLFLNDNNVSVVTTQGLSSSLGEAENLNNVHFSTNVGIGFKYRFFKSFQASFEPTFKYQINTFSGNSGNFKPYFIGLYSGVSFRF